MALPNDAPRVPLWRQLQAVARLVQGVRDGRSLSQQLEGVEPTLRPGAQALSFAALRWLGRAQALRSLLVRRVPAPLADALLCTSLALAQDGAMYEPFTLVDQTVEAAKRDRAMRAHAGLLNACLRRFLREREALTEAAMADAVARWNHPLWWIERLQRDHPAQWQGILEAAQHAAPMDMRVNPRRTSVAEYLAQLERAGIEACSMGGMAIRLRQPRPVRDLPGFLDGLVSVQSAAAQRAAALLLDHMSERAPRVLDACAAPGGKTAHLLERVPEAAVTALEIDAHRAARIGENLSRLGLQADVRVADAAAVETWWTDELYDAILLDAPCSASGIVSRHPDVRWLRRESDIAQLAAQQDRLLAALWPLLKPGGNLLYCTCSVFVEEGRNRIESFLAHNSGAVCMPSPGHLLPVPAEAQAGVDDNRQREDGFYYALLHKPVA